MAKEFVPSSFDRENAEYRRKIEILNAVRIGPEQKAQIILVVLGLKPAAELALYEDNDNVETIEAALRQAGLLFTKKETDGPVESKRLFCEYAFANVASTLEQLSLIDSKSDHAAYGRLMGYPPSAIDAFIDKEKLLPADEYPDMAGVIFSFKLSKGGWQAELATLRQWSEAIKEFAPAVYQELDK